MSAHDFLSLYSAKTLEYLIAIAYLLAFVPFWRFVNGHRAPARVAAAVRPRWRDVLVDGFHVPDSIFFHPGHSWVATSDGGCVKVGVDDFGQKLVGAISALELPQPGDTVGRDLRAWTMIAEGKALDMLAPVDGTVVEINHKVVEHPELLQHDPYGEGWLLKIQTPWTWENPQGLAEGSAARRWIADNAEKLYAQAGQELGTLAQDGGTPVHGIAKVLSPDKWDELVRTFFLT